MPITAFDQVFRDSWRRLAAPEFRRYFLLNHELLALAIREPRRYRSFLNTTTEQWRTGLAAALESRGCSTRVTRRSSRSGEPPGVLRAVARAREF